MDIRRMIFTGTDHNPIWVFDKTTDEVKIEDNHVLLKIRLATICESDLHTALGKCPAPTPMVLGHEAVGEIVIDKRPHSLPQGTRVTFSTTSSCNDCKRCRLGLPENCLKVQKVGYSPFSVNLGLNGCFASHLILNPGNHIVAIPDSITDRAAAPINCALATAMNAVEQARTGELDRTALILGAGLHGIYTCAVLKENGYEEVFCSDININRLKAAKLFGAESIHAQKLLDNDCEVSEVDVVFHMCSNPDLLQEGYRRLRHGGCLVLVGFGHTESMINLTGEQIISKSLTIKGVHDYAPKHLNEALEFLTKTVNRYPYEDLVNPHPYALEHLERALSESGKRLYHRSSVIP